MFHLLKWKPLSSYSFRALTDSVQLPIYCNFCQHLSQNGLYKESLRYYSSITNTALQNSSRKKKRQRRTKKYAELLEISDRSMIETKATISNLRAKHLSLIVDNPDINLGELHKIKKLSKKVLKKNNSTLSNENNSKLSSDSIKPVNDLITSEYNSDDIKVLHEESEIHRNDVEAIDPELLNEHLTGFNSKISSPLLEDSIIDRNIMEELERSEIEKIDEITESIKNVNKKTVKTSEKRKNRCKKAQQIQNDATYALREKLAREDTLSRLLLAYTSLCMAQNKPQKALGAIMFYRDRAKRSETCPNVTDIRVYNCVLEGFSSKGNIGKVRDILGFLNEDKIKPNLQTYISIFDCLGRIKKMSSVKAQLEFYQAQMQEQGYTLNDLMNNGKFINDQREVILAAIRQFKTNFNPIYVAPNIQYDCSLLNSLNNAEQKHLLESIKPIDNNFRINFKEDKNTAYISVPDTSLGGISLLHPNLTSKHSIENLNISETNDTPSYTEKNLCKYNEQESKQNFFSSDFIKGKAKQQLRIESHGYISVKSIEKQTEPTDVVQHLRTKLKETQQNWQKTIIECLQRDLANLNAHSTAAGSGRGAKGAPSLSACIQALPPNELAQIVLQEVQKLSEGSETYSPSTGTLYRELGFIVHSRYQVKLKSETGILDKVGNIYERYCDWYITDYNKSKNTISERQINPRQCWQTLVHADRTGPSIDVEDKIWPVSLITAVGKFLYNIILKDLKIDVNAVRVNSKQSKLLPAFYTLFRSQGHLIKEEIKAHPAVTRLFRGAQLPYITFSVNQLPMICPPRPWVTAKQPGGYLVVHADVIRLPPQAAQQTQRLAETTMMKLYPALDSLNQLAAVPWKVNQDILDIVLDVFRSGGSARLGVAPPPSACPAALPPATGASKAERYQAFRQRMIVRRRKAEMYSLWCDALYRFSLANHYRYDTFWLPHNMDFRGRVYPVPPHLTHLGADIARSLLIFAQPQPLGPNGLRWLKLHLVNLTGTRKKNSIQERLDYANQIMPDILDSADFPLTGKMWWAKSEEPWQTLASCREIAKAVRSPDPEKYETQFPVHQDGSCNGLQHYAALGRDAAGARSVNLTPSEKPQDVYTAVANLVEETRKQDAKSGMKIAQILDGFVKRKVIKQTVMTTVYGVTRFGARLQIARQLKDIDEFPKEHVWAASSYLTGRTLDSLRSMFTSTREIQDWFTECARLVAAVCGQNLEWVTPLGLPVVQPYSRYRKVDNQGPNSKHKLQDHFCLDTYERPNIMKQKNAFPPNFIHSLDSSHMMLTSLFCEQAGITFVSVHDCFWTHPSTVEIMNKICREQFVALHSEPILEDLSEFLTRKYGYDAEEVSTNNFSIDQNRKRLNRILRQLPKTGDFDLSSVLESVYFFS